MSTSSSRATFVTSAVACTRDHRPSEACAYRVAWAINPHMRPGTGDPVEAAKEARRLAAALHAEGAQTIELPFVHGAHDSVFTKDAALLLEGPRGRRALLARPANAERAAEPAARARSLEALGFEIVTAPRNTWEGGDVAVLPDGKGLLLGHGLRSDRTAAAWLEIRTELPVVPLELRDPHLFHLDMALTVLPDGTVLACDEVFAPGALRELERWDGVRDVVRIPRAEALAFGLNVVPVGEAVLCPADAPTVEAALRRRALRPVRVELREFQLAGGSAACLVARVHPDAREAARVERRDSAVA